MSGSSFFTWLFWIVVVGLVLRFILNGFAGDIEAKKRKEKEAKEQADRDALLAEVKGLREQVASGRSSVDQSQLVYTETGAVASSVPPAAAVLTDHQDTAAAPPPSDEITPASALKFVVVLFAIIAVIFIVVSFFIKPA